MPSRLGPPLTLLVLAGPVVAGLGGTVLPAFGWLPALGGNTVSADPFRALFDEPGIWHSAALSLWSGLAATALSLVAVMLFLAGWSGTRTFSRMRHTISPLLSVPHAAAAFGFAFLLAPSGIAARLVSPWLTGWQQPPDLLIVNDPLGLSLVAGLAVKEIPFLLLVALAALPQLPAAGNARVAAALGYGRVAGFLLTTWPAVYRQIRLAVFAVLAFSTSVVDVAAILGPTLPETLALRLARWMADPDLAMRFKASAGALMQLGVTTLALAIWIALEHVGAALRNRAAFAGRRARHDAGLRGAGIGLMALACALVFGGLAVLGIWSLAGLWQFPDALPADWTLRSWTTTVPRIGEPLVNSLIAGLLATAIAVALTLMCLRNEDRTGQPPGRGAKLLIYMPLLVPQAAFLFGLQLLALLSGFMASLPALVFAHLVFVLPYVFLSLSDPWRAHDPRYEQVAVGLGRSRLAVLWRVKLPMLLPAILTAAAVGFAVSIGQYLPSLLIGAGRLPTVTTEAVALASGGNRRVIGVWALVQALLPFAGFALAATIAALRFRRFRAMRA